MSNLKNIKKQSDITINFSDFVDYIFEGCPSKYKEMVLLLMNKTLKNEETNEYIKRDVLEYLKYDLNLHDTELKTISNLNNLSSVYFIRRILNFSAYNEILEFIKLHMNGSFPSIDLTSFSSFHDIKNQVDFFKTKKMGELTEDQYEKFYEDKNWLILIPFTHLASVNYGYNTKWCVSMVDKPSYFFEHINDSFIFFIIDKTNDKKVAAAFNKNFFNFYDNMDKQRDSITFNFPEIILTKIREIHKINKTSFEYISNEVKEKYFYLEQTKNKVSQPIIEELIYLNR